MCMGLTITFDHNAKTEQNVRQLQQLNCVYMFLCVPSMLVTVRSQW